MSLFNNLLALGFTQDEIDTIDEWRKAIRNSLEGRAIEKNCQLETRVRDDIRKEFLRRIIEKFRETNDPIKSIRSAVSKAKNPYQKDPPVIDPLLLQVGKLKLICLRILSDLLGHFF